MLKKILIICVLFLCIGSFSAVNAQDGLAKMEKDALLLLSQKDYAKAMPMLHQLFEAAPYDKKYYDNYYKALIEIKSYDTAIALGDYMSKIRREDLSVRVDVGHAYELKGDKKNAVKIYNETLAQLGNNEYQATGLATGFRFIENLDYEIKTYEAFQEKILNPYAFAYELAILYDKKGETDKAIDMLLRALQVQPYGMENAKQAMERVVDQDPKKLKKAEAAIAKKIKQEPANYLWKELFSWIQSGKGDKSDQLKEMIKLDEQQGSQGALVLNWSKEQFQKEALEHALQGLDYIEKLPGDFPVKPTARQMYLDIQLLKLEHTFPVVAAQVQKILNDYQDYFQRYVNMRNSKAMLDYTTVLALFADAPQAAFDTLSRFVETPYVAAPLVGAAKLNMGDYQVLMGNVWQAALLYSQVDKAFKEDELGEEARFRNAKLSYYRGDFEYAQGQLSVLKASTSEFIANDALYLSVLITENTPEDKNFDAFQAFAKADLLQFQHKYVAADKLLDSLSIAAPEDELQDDILMQRTNIATKMQDYEKAIGFLNIIAIKYVEDVLADDALMRLGEIYEKQFKDFTKAKAAYESLILQFPGSSFIQQARAKFQALSAQGT